MTDQLRADSVGAFGNPVVETPHLDALAADGVRFTDAHVQHTVCSQSRISMFTGWYPHVAGHRTLSHLLRPHEPNVFRRLRAAGYHVAHAGARGDMLGPGVTETSTDRWGFTRPPDRDALAATFSAGTARDDPRYFTMWGGPHDTDDPYDLDEATIATTLDWFAEMPEPWCVLVPLIAPHPPFAVGRRWYGHHDRSAVPEPLAVPTGREPGFRAAIRERYGLAAVSPEDWAEVIGTYYDMIRRVDDQFGRLRSGLEAAGVAERTVTFAFTDHGEYLGDMGLVEKWMSGVEPCLTRNPLIVHDPRGSSGVSNTFVELVDLTPTLLDYAEIEPDWTQFGRSFRGLLEAPDASHRDVAVTEGGFTVAEEPLLESGATGHYEPKQTLQHDRPELAGRVIAMRTDRWTHVERLYEAPELYDRLDDPDELVNLADEPGHAATVAEGRDRIFRWLFETSDVVPWRADPRMAPEIRATFAGRPGTGRPLIDPEEGSP